MCQSKVRALLHPQLLPSCLFVLGSWNCTFWWGGVGYYGLQGACNICPAGKYAEEEGSGNCTDCAAGKFLMDDGWEWQLHILELACTLCPLGSFSNVSGASDCYFCDPGSFTGELGLTECQTCTRGVAMMMGSTSCEICWSGTGPNANRDNCIECDPGYFSDSGTCEACAAGKYADWPGSMECYDCWQGTYSNGTFCVDCPAGRSSSDGASSCTQCPRGKASIGGSYFLCETCSGGTYAEVESAWCTPCDGGNYSLSGAFQCTACRLGTYSTSGSSSCESCSVGLIPNSAQDQCVDCPAGKKRDFADSACLDCGPGRAAPAGSPWCDSCSAGLYPLADKSACEACPAGKVARLGSSSCSFCEGGFVPDWLQENCDPCWPGTYAEPGNESCISCEAGRYNSKAAQSACTACPKGTFLDYPGGMDAYECIPCTGDTTLNEGSSSMSECIIPDWGQTFECISGKPCAISNVSGSGLVDSHSIMIKAYGFFCWDNTAVSGFGTDGRSGQGSTNYSWSGVLSASPGNYSVCWCGGISKTCSDATVYTLDMGVMWVSGPFSGQQFYCVKGQNCNNAGPIQGLGLTASDQIWVRDGCTIDFARQPGSQQAYVKGQEDLVTGVVDLYLDMGFITTEIPAGDYKGCWCSSKGTSCSTMNLSATATSTLYLEYEAATLTIEGPGSTANLECFVGQPCTLELPLNEGVNLGAGDRLSALEQCGQGTLLRGLPGDGIALTEDGRQFQFPVATGTSGYLEADPGYFRLCWCRPNNDTNLQCNMPTDFSVAAGLFIAAGPYSGQTYQCQIGQFFHVFAPSCNADQLSISFGYCIFPQTGYLWGVLTPLKGVHPRAAWFYICLRACIPAWSTLWMLCPHDFTCVSHLSPLVSHLSPTTLWMLCPQDFTFVSHLSPLVSHLSPSTLWMLCPHGFTLALVSHLSPTTFASHLSLLVYHLSPTRLCMFCPHDFTFALLPVRSGCSARMILTCFRLSPTCLPVRSGCFARMILHLSPTCFRLSSTCLPVCSECFGPHDFALVSPLSPTTLSILCPYYFRLHWMIWMLWSARFRTYLTCLPYTLYSLPAWFLVCPPPWMLWVLWSAWFRTCLPLVFQLSPTNSARVVSGLSSTCPRLPLHSGFSARVISGLSPSTLWMLWVLWSAWFRTCLPVVSHCTLDSLLAWFQPCLSLVSTCLPLVTQYTLDALNALVPMISRLFSPSCLPRKSGFSARVIIPLVSTCLPVRSGCSECFGPHDFALVYNLSRSCTCLRLVSYYTLDP